MKIVQTTWHRPQCAPRTPEKRRPEATAPGARPVPDLLQLFGESPSRSPNRTPTSTPPTPGKNLEQLPAVRVVIGTKERQLADAGSQSPLLRRRWRASRPRRRNRSGRSRSAQRRKFCWRSPRRNSWLGQRRLEADFDTFQGKKGVRAVQKKEAGWRDLSQELIQSLLIQKLAEYGILGATKDWFINYLAGRKQTIVAGDVSSAEEVALTGVPLGSRLGPIYIICK
ncbi:hypothetical protein DMENIID0001_121250 [Sergentomyia squamirostris]